MRHPLVLFLVVIASVVALGLPVANAALPAGLPDGSTSAELDPLPLGRSAVGDLGAAVAAAGAAPAQPDVAALDGEPEVVEQATQGLEATLEAGAAQPAAEQKADPAGVAAVEQAVPVAGTEPAPLYSLSAADQDRSQDHKQDRDKQGKRICGPRRIGDKVDILCWNEGETPPGEPVDAQPALPAAPAQPPAPVCPDADHDCVPDAQDPDYVDPRTGIRNWDNPDWRDDDLDGLSNSSDPYPNGECVPNTSQDANCDGIRELADRDRLLAAGNAEMARQWECSEDHYRSDCHVNWVGPRTTPQFYGDEDPDQLGPRQPAGVPATPAPAAPAIAPGRVGGSLAVPARQGALLDLGAIRTSADELFSGPLGWLTRAALNAPADAYAAVKLAANQALGNYRVRECKLAVDGIFECTVDGLRTGPLDSTGLHPAGNVILLDSSLTPAERAHVRAHEVRHATQAAVFGPTIDGLSLAGRAAGAIVSPRRYPDCPKLEEMAAEDFQDGVRIGFYTNYYNCRELWDELNIFGQQVIDLD